MYDISNQKRGVHWINGKWEGQLVDKDGINQVGHFGLLHYSWVVVACITKVYRHLLYPDISNVSNYISYHVAP